MKRSKDIRRPRFRKSLPVATTLSVSVGLSGCSPPPQQEEAGIYRNAAECEQVYPDRVEQCEQVFNSAQMDHLATAPRFDGLAQCEADFGAGNCEPAPENRVAEEQPNEPSQAGFGGGWFMPMMMGYMMGNMIGGRSLRQTPVYSSSARNSPINNKIVTGKGDVVGNRGDRRVRVAPAAFQKPSSPARVTRTGGFGAMAAQKSRASSRKTTSSRSTRRSYGG
jgi:uncharacterized protein YgiB involved in biofilm formation